ncbi:MAG: OmpA family protein [Lysobacterales bacterium]
MPIAVEGMGNDLKVGMEQALMAIDGNDIGFSVTPKPGPAETEIVFVYQLPANTTFEAFAVPGVFETPSPYQTFFKNVTIAGSGESADGPYETLATSTLSTHSKAGEETAFDASVVKPVKWLRISLQGGIDIQRDKTFFEFSEISGYGSQESTPLAEGFNGKWKGKGVILELKQDGRQVSGCYDREGELEGTVSGNVLIATGKTLTAGIPSAFVLIVDNNNEIIGVRSTNGAPFKLYSGDANPDLVTQCSKDAVTVVGCGSIIHGINFDYDSAVIKEESKPLIALLAKNLASEAAVRVTVIGHTSSEGSDAYNEKLSQQRAQSVVAALIEDGLNDAQLSAVGQGEKMPIADNATEAGRSLNRRVEINCGE